MPKKAIEKLKASMLLLEKEHEANNKRIAILTKNTKRLQNKYK